MKKNGSKIKDMSLERQAGKQGERNVNNTQSLMIRDTVKINT
jgi:hypothetical protein